MRDASCKFRKTEEGGSAIRLCASWWDSDVCDVSPFVLSLLVHLNSNYILFCYKIVGCISLWDF